MHFILAAALLIGPAPAADLIGTWDGPHVMHLLSKREWPTVFPDRMTLLLQTYQPPDYQYGALARCHFEHAGDKLLLRDCPYAGEYRKRSTEQLWWKRKGEE